MWTCICLYVIDSIGLFLFFPDLEIEGYVVRTRTGAATWVCPTPVAKLVILKDLHAWCLVPITNIMSTMLILKDLYTTTYGIPGG